TNANGSGERWLARCPRPDPCFGPALSPNGTSLALSRSRSLYVVDLATSRMRRLTVRPDCEPAGACPDCTHWYCAAHELAPAWSPDGSRIAFARVLHGCAVGCLAEPYVVNADGTGLKRLSSRAGPQLQPLWSPDGRTIAFN